MRRIGVDVGGTFTDLIYVDDNTGEVVVHKLPTTSDDPSRGTVDGVIALCSNVNVHLTDIHQFFHGTTIATNIVVEHNGAEVGMLTTEGFRDILHIARHKRPLNFSNYQDLPWQRYPLVKRRNRMTVTERIGVGGEIIVPLDEADARQKIEKLADAGINSIAICLLFSFANTQHEQRLAEMVREVLPGAFLSVSSEIIPQYREYERFSTVALNAYVGPKVAKYVRALEDELTKQGLRGGVHLMTSASGVVTASSAITKPVNLLMSGPVAGVIGGMWAAKQSGYESAITLDVGGTSADIGLAQNATLRMKHLLDTRVGPYQAMIPMVDVDTIGAGGGSIAYVDAGGMFRVGPRSAGAIPGPAAYGRGGTEATASDALVNLGWLVPESFLGGAMELDTDAAWKAFERGPASALGMSVEEASFGAIAILTYSMVQAIEENSVRRGYDPREFALVAAGGAGPLFGAQIGLEMSMECVIVPPHPGITSATGLLATDMVYEYALTAYETLSTIDTGAVQRKFEGIESEAVEQLRSDGLSDENIVLERVVDCRYVGQGYELRVPAPTGSIDDKWCQKVAEMFHAQHEREFSRRYEELDIQIPNIRVRAIGLTPALTLPEIEKGGLSSDSALLFERPAWFKVDEDLKAVPTRYYRRDRLMAGNEFAGPAVIVQYDSTTVVPPGVIARVDKVGNLVLGRA